MAIHFEADLHLPEPCLKVALVAYQQQLAEFLMGKRKGPTPLRPSSKVPPPHTPQDERLWKAIQNGTRPDALNKLIAMGANVNARDEDGRTALHMATRKHRPDHVALLLKAGANATLADDYGNGAIHYTTAAILPLLLHAGADVNMPGNFGYTPLHYAVAREDGALVGQMVSAGANLDTSADDTQGRTPLVAALGLRDSLPMVGLLVSLGADVNKTDAFGWRPLDIVLRAHRFHGDSDKAAITKILRDAGAKAFRSKTRLPACNNTPTLR
ncbi:MAG TPA: hypothetical protein DCW68_02400 [Rhodospirillaceae bacterium]|nr:MAG: hypothetical protein A2018_05370 [Alphaproteobacteria bacterium GWF2_58_20]HAU28945.1 hypothetical protein [Rhodospirillaceae bacterium]